MAEQTEFRDEADSIGGGDGKSQLLPDPGLIWQVFRRNIGRFVVAVLAVLLLAAAYLALQQPLYRADASLLIDPVVEPVRSPSANVGKPFVDADQVDTEIRLLSSSLVAERAAKLYAERFASPDGDRYSPIEVQDLAKRIRGSTRVSRSGQTRVIDITSISDDRNFAATAANLLAEAYLNAQVEAKTSVNDNTKNFVNARLQELEGNALRTQAAVDNFRAANGLASANGSTNAEQEVSNLNQQLASARADLAEKQGRYNAAREQLLRGGGGADVGAALGSGTIASLRQQEARASADYAVLASRLGPLHPERQQKERELEDVRQRIQEEINRVLSSLQADVQTAQSRVASLSGSRGSAAGSLAQNARAQTRLSELEARAQAAATVYQAFLQRSQEAGALRDSAMPDARFAQRADVPVRPFSPNYPLTVLFAGVGALLAGILTVIISEYLRRGVQTKRDIERRLRLRYAGAVPSLRSTVKSRKLLQPPHIYVLEHPFSLFAEAFRSIRTFLTLSPGARPRVIAITSALPREGKTTTSVCLAQTTAAEGARTILVDGDLRRRGASSLLGYESEFDIIDYLERRQPLSACLMQDEVTGLHILGVNRSLDAARNPMTIERVNEMLGELRELYDVAIVDTAPILGVAEGRILAMAADRVLLITHWRKTSVRAVEATIDMLLDAGAKITGMALTQVDIRKYASTGDGDVYAYAKKFRGYYTN